MYIMETAYLRFRPLTEADTPLFESLFQHRSMLTGLINPVRDRLPYTLAVCPAGRESASGFLSLEPVLTDDLSFTVRAELPGISDSLWSHAVDSFIRYVPHRFGITEVSLHQTDLPSEDCCFHAGFALRDGEYLRFSAWETPALEELSDPPVRLVCRRVTPPDVMRDWTAVLDYDLFVQKERIGCCSLRMGYNEALFYGGQISYTVFPMYRGHGYAASAVSLLFDYAARCGMPMLSITCVPDNIASRRTAEKAGFICEGEYNIPKDLGMYSEKRRIARRYVRKA